MDTTFWGPHAWKFLFSVVTNYANLNWKGMTSKEELEVKSDHKQFFYLLGKVLPCKYCRESYTKFTKEIPIDNYMDNPYDLLYWLYLIKNKVNDKLRAQYEAGLPHTHYVPPNPPFLQIVEEYEKYLAKSCANGRTSKPVKCVRPYNSREKFSSRR